MSGRSSAEAGGSGVLSCGSLPGSLAGRGRVTRRRGGCCRAQREVLVGLRGVVHVVGGPDVLRGCVLTALLRPEERVLQHPARAVGQAVRLRVPQPTLLSPLRQLLPWQPAFQQPCPLSSARPPRYPKAPPTPLEATAASPSSAATAAVSSMACAAPRSTS